MKKMLLAVLIFGVLSSRPAMAAADDVAAPVPLFQAKSADCQKQADTYNGYAATYNENLKRADEMQQEIAKQQPRIDELRRQIDALQERLKALMPRGPEANQKKYDDDMTRVELAKLTGELGNIQKSSSYPGAKSYLARLPEQQADLQQKMTEAQEKLHICEEEHKACAYVAPDNLAELPADKRMAEQKKGTEALTKELNSNIAAEAAVAQKYRGQKAELDSRHNHIGGNMSLAEYNSESAALKAKEDRELAPLHRASTRSRDCLGNYIKALAAGAQHP